MLGCLRLTLVVLPLLVAPASASPPEMPRAGAARVIPAAGLREDVEILRRVYEAAHPGLFRYNTRADWGRHLDELRGEFARDRTLAEAYLAFSKFLARLKCGHSYANFFNQPKATAEALFKGKNLVPFAFRWVDGRMIATRALEPGLDLKPGTEVLEIGGVPTAEILARLLTVARADGGNDAKRLAYLEVRGTGSYEAFDVFLPLFYPAIAERIALRVHAPGAGAPSTLTVDAHDLDRRAALARASAPAGDGDGDDGPRWKFETLDDGNAYLRMDGWALYNSKWDWAGFLDRGVDDLIDRKVPGLIVDIRENEGGLDVGHALIARLAAREVRDDAFARFTRYRTLSLPESFSDYLSTWDPSFKDWGDAARPDRSGFFRLTKYDDADGATAIAPKGRRFEGKVAVLIGPTNSSATFGFAQLVKANRLATLVGRPTGGNRRGINGGAFFFVTLPNSQVEVDLPLIATFPAASAGPLPDGERVPFADIPDAGIEPDVLVVPTADNIARGVDPELLAAKSALRARAD